MNTNTFIAHTRDDGKTQSLLDHLTGTAKIARENAFGWGEEFAYVCGLAHDIGKYSTAFQKRINGANVRVDHATAGGQVLNTPQLSGLGTLTTYSIMGHHSGLPNGGTEKQAQGDKSDTTLYGRLKRKVEDFESLFTNKSSKCRKLHNSAVSRYLFRNSRASPASFFSSGIYPKPFRASLFLFLLVTPRFRKLFSRRPLP